MEDFNKWIKDFEKKLKSNYGRDGYIPDRERNNLLPLYTAYKQIETNKKLVLATWVLAGATIILSILTLILR